MTIRNRKPRGETVATWIMFTFGVVLVGAALLQTASTPGPHTVPENPPTDAPAGKAPPKVDASAPNAHPVAVLLPPPPVSAEPAAEKRQPAPPAARAEAATAPPTWTALRPTAPDAVSVSHKPTTPMQPATAVPKQKPRLPAVARRPLSPLVAKAPEPSPRIVPPIKAIAPHAPPTPARAAAATGPALADDELPLPEQTAPSPARPAPDPVEPSDPSDGAAAPAASGNWNRTALEADGRVLLRLLEHDSGPSVRIAWPEDGQRRERLYAVLSACYGMRSAWIMPDGRIAGDDALLGRDGLVATDRYSGFIREARGKLPRAEIRRLRSMGTPAAGAAPVRLFPRQVDAIFLGGLRRIVGEGYAGMRAVVARYRLSGSNLALEDIRVDGQPIAGNIPISPIRHCSL